MRYARLGVILVLLSCSMSGQSRISGTCQSDGSYPNCLGGEITFTGSGFAAQVHVTVKNSAGKIIDDGDYATSGGVLRFMENLSFADTYTISIDGQVILTVTTTQ